MRIWAGLRRWEVVVHVLVGSDIDRDLMPALQEQLGRLLPDKVPSDSVWTSLLKEPQDRHVLRARIVIATGSPGVAVDRALELLQSACTVLDVNIVDVEQVKVTLAAAQLLSADAYSFARRST